jgi:hypothetical protein
LTVPATGNYTLLVRDKNNIQLSNYSLRYTIENSAPIIESLNPASGSSQPNKPVNFTSAFIDPDSADYTGIQFAYLLINNSTAGANCFWAYYNQNTNKLYLRNDTNSSWLGGFAPGSANIIENSFAKLDCQQTTVSGAQKILTINWSVTFKFAFSGRSYNMYLYVKDDRNANSGWVQKGTWTIDPIEIVSFFPLDKSSFIEDAVIHCAVNAIPENPLYQYQFLVDGQIRRPYSAENSWDWRADAQDIGRRTLTVQVKNQEGGGTQIAHSLLIYRHPIEPQE